MKYKSNNFQHIYLNSDKYSWFLQSEDERVFDCCFYYCTMIVAVVVAWKVLNKSERTHVFNVWHRFKRNNNKNNNNKFRI